jgi:hypothetical protein
MPTGAADSLTPVARFIEWLQPARVLDVGVGSGRMGFIAREYGNVPWLREGRDDGIVVDGIEGYEPYLGKVQRAIYDDLVVGEANEILVRMAKARARYDLVIAAEILEHFSTEDGARFLNRCQAIGDVVLVTTPSWYFDQEIAENPLETHRSFWSPADLRRAGATGFLLQGLTTVCLFGSPVIARRFRDERPATAPPRWFQWVLPHAWEQLLRRARAARTDSR